MIQRWHDYQPTKKQTFWIALGRIIATLVIGFGFGGWVTGGTAQEMAAQAAQDSRLELAAAVCAEDLPGESDANGAVAAMCATRLAESAETVG